MVRRPPSLASIKRQIAIERSKISRASERTTLERELKELRRGGRTDIAARIGRGALILGKKVGKATLKQAQLIKAEQIREAKERRTEQLVERVVPVRRVVRVKKRRRKVTKRIQPQDTGFFGGLPDIGNIGF